MESHPTENPQSSEVEERHDPPPTYLNTSPRENQDPHEDDVARGRERWEAVLGR
jgi:hypothetical protein